MPGLRVALPLDTWLKALAAGVSALFVVVVLAGGPRRAPNQFLAAFLTLIALNQAAEMMRSLQTDPAGTVRWFRVATVAAALDPFALAYFALIHPRRSRLARTPLVLLAGLPAAGFALAAPILLPLESRVPASDYALIGLTFYTMACYTGVLVALALRHGNEDDAGSDRLLFVALCAAAIPLWSRSVGAVVHDALGYIGPGLVPPRLIAESFALGLGCLGLLHLVRTRGAPTARRAIGPGLALGGGLAAAILVSPLLVDYAPPALSALGNAIGRGAAALRWLAFGALVSTAILRHRLLGMSLARRRAAARLVLGAAFFLLAGAALTLARVALGLEAFSTSTPEVVILLAALVASQGFRGLVDTAAARLYGVPVAGDAGARESTYERAAVEALGDADARSTRDMERLRAELGLDAATARRIEQRAAARGLHPRALVAGRYRIDRLLGAGGAARAFLAKDEILLRDVVIKELRIADGSERLAIQEARLAGAVQSPHVVVVHDVLAIPGSTLIVSEYAPGGSLQERLADGPLPAEEALRVFEDVLLGLAAVHARGIVHRDLKPANVLLTADGRAKLGDFGVARALAEGTLDERSPPVVGTPAYMAPETRRGEPATAATDVYLAAQLARRLVPQPPAELARVLARASAPAPADRWRDADAMLAAWREALRIGTAGPNVPRG